VEVAELGTIKQDLLVDLVAVVVVDRAEQLQEELDSTGKDLPAVQHQKHNLAMLDYLMAVQLLDITGLAAAEQVALAEPLNYMPT
jgi:hypothetical protein